MNEDKLMQLLNSLDDDLVDKEIDKLLEGVEIDMKSINEQAHKKLNNQYKKANSRKRHFYLAAACLGILSVTTLYARDISEAIMSFFNKTPVYSTIVDGDAYYLKESCTLNEHLTIESIMVSEGKLDMELTSDLSLDKLGDIHIIAKDNPSIVYFPGGYSYEDNKYSFSFMNETEQNYNITPFKEFDFIIAGNTYEVSLDEAVSFDANSKIYTPDTAKISVEGVNIGAKIIDSNGKVNIQLITSFEDEKLKLSRLGKPKEISSHGTFENLGERGTIGSSGSSEVEALYVLDEAGNHYTLDIPKDSKGRPVTLFETNAPKGKALTLKLPAIIASYHEQIDTLQVSIPKEGEILINKEIDFKIQKARVKSIKRTSPTSAEIEFELNTGLNDKINLRSFNFYSTNLQKITAKFNSNKAVMTLVFDEKVAHADLEISYPYFVIDGDWVIDMK